MIGAVKTTVARHIKNTPGILSNVSMETVWLDCEVPCVGMVTVAMAAGKMAITPTTRKGK